MKKAALQVVRYGKEFLERYPNEKVKLVVIGPWNKGCSYSKRTGDGLYVLQFNTTVVSIIVGLLL